MRKKKIETRMLRLSIPAIRELRQAIEKGDAGIGYLVSAGEKTNASSVKVRYVLKKKPWVVTIEAKRHGH